MSDSSLILGGVFGYVDVLYVLCFIVQFWASARLRKYRFELDTHAHNLDDREKELDKVERWLDKREIQLEKRIDKLHSVGVRF